MKRVGSGRHTSTLFVKRLVQSPERITRRATIIILMSISLLVAWVCGNRGEASEISWNELINAMQQHPFGFYNCVAVNVFGYDQHNIGDGKRDGANSVDAGTYRAITLHFSNEYGNFTGSAAAGADAQIGKMTGTASTGGACEIYTFGTEASSMAGFWDTITITTNQTPAAFIQLNGLISGKLLTTAADINTAALIEVRAAAGMKPPGQGNLVLNAELGFYANGDSWQEGDPTLGGGQEVPFSVKIPYAGGPTRFSLELGPGALLHSGGTGTLGFGDAAADFTHTLVVTGLQVLDASGNPINDATWVVASGHAYNAPPASSSHIFLPLILRD
jgi:hypothetical protein